MFYEAIFEPTEKENYNDEALRHAHTRIAVNEGWVAKDGPFKGQQCFYVPNSTVGCIPVSDLKEIKPVPAVQWTEIHKRMGYNKG